MWIKLIQRPSLCINGEGHLSSFANAVLATCFAFFAHGAAFADVTCFDNRCWGTNTGNFVIDLSSNPSTFYGFDNFGTVTVIGNGSADWYGNNYGAFDATGALGFSMQGANYGSVKGTDLGLGALAMFRNYGTVALNSFSGSGVIYNYSTMKLVGNSGSNDFYNFGSVESAGGFRADVVVNNSGAELAFSSLATSFLTNDGKLAVDGQLTTRNFQNSSFATIGGLVVNPGDSVNNPVLHVAQGATLTSTGVISLLTGCANFCDVQYSIDGTLNALRGVEVGYNRDVTGADLVGSGVVNGDVRVYGGSSVGANLTVNGSVTYVDGPPPMVPEPGTAVLMIIGIAAFSVCARSNKRV